jgi:hypothetical protein
VLGSSYIDPFATAVKLHNSVFDSALDQKTAFSDARQQERGRVIEFYKSTAKSA